LSRIAAVAASARLPIPATGHGCSSWLSHNLNLFVIHS
jgi:hypothetical protein